MCSHAPVPMDCGCYGSPYLLLWSLQHSALVASPDPAHPSCVAQGRGCGVWQHCDCLGLAAPPAKFLCELCRARLADPFWEVTEQVLPPSRLKPTVSGGQGCMRKVAGPLQAGMLLRMQCLVAVGSSGQPWRLASLPCHAGRPRQAWPPTAHTALSPAPLAPLAPNVQPGRPPVVTSHGPQEVQSADRVFYLNQQQLEPAQQDPANHRVQVRLLADRSSSWQMWAGSCTWRWVGAGKFGAGK